MKLVMELWTKYCSFSAKWEINISASMKRRLFKKIGKIQDEEKRDQITLEMLYTIFDPIIDEMHKLMDAPLDHFTETEEFKKLKESIRRGTKTKYELDSNDDDEEDKPLAVELVAIKSQSNEDVDTMSP